MPVAGSAPRGLWLAFLSLALLACGCATCQEQELPAMLLRRLLHDEPNRMLQTLGKVRVLRGLPQPWCRADGSNHSAALHIGTRRAGQRP